MRTFAALYLTPYDALQPGIGLASPGHVSRLLHLRESRSRILNPEIQGRPSGGADEATRSSSDGHEKNNSEWDWNTVTHGPMNWVRKYKIRKVVMLSLVSLGTSITTPARAQLVEEFGLTMSLVIGAFVVDRKGLRWTQWTLLFSFFAAISYVFSTVQGFGIGQEDLVSISIAVESVQAV
ncbi:major facilitator superfamily transporter [Colletotrichum fioriniae PJ7]|uniref:Major facilitator superfamily transporter n=1 Tax=Colletotrichum fioriniae PJ7 TaxID=1445577 RepID=A0A010QHE1_9PEZI|nr:major facilitator superfamily transporter [Colletotrichum fioriniae PJ7]